jgi:hypothetical protein
MGDTIVISNKMTNSIISGFPFDYPEIKAKASFCYLGFNSLWDVIVPVAPDIIYSESYLNMLASEDVLKRDWDNPIEDEVWADL